MTPISTAQILGATLRVARKRMGLTIVQTLTDEIARLRALSAGRVVAMGKQSNRQHSQAIASRPFF